MKNSASFAVSVVFMGTILLSLRTISRPESQDSTEKMIMSCSPYSNAGLVPMADGKFIVALSGWGDYTYPISTNVDSAQFYFNQGLSMYYSYHMREANASFREASRFDPANAMCYWGQA